MTAALQLLDDTSLSSAVNRAMRLFTDVMRLALLHDHPGAVDEHASALEEAILALNKHMYSMPGVQLTPQFHRLLHLPDVLRRARQLEGINCWQVF